MSAARGGHRTVYGLCVHAAGAWSHRNGHQMDAEYNAAHKREQLRRMVEEGQDDGREA